MNEIHEKVAKIAAHMGEGWTVEVNPEIGHGATITGPSGESLWVFRQMAQGPKRLAIYGRYQQVGKPETYRQMRVPEGVHMTVAEERAPEAIAKEIHRRILPTYGPTLAEYVARVAGYEAGQEAAEAVEAEIVKATAGYKGHQGNIMWTGGSARVWHGGAKVAVEGTVSPATALAIIAMMRAEAEAEAAK